jgi:hypothetical protein
MLVWGLGVVFQLSHYFRIFAREMWSFLPSSFLGRGAILRRKYAAKSSYVLFLEFKRSLGVCYL